jgi:hypothetical protein
MDIRTFHLKQANFTWMTVDSDEDCDPTLVADGMARIAKSSQSDVLVIDVVDENALCGEVRIEWRQHWMLSESNSVLALACGATEMSERVTRTLFSVGSYPTNSRKVNSE